MWVKLMLVGLIVAALALAGCGGGGDSDDSDLSGSAGTATSSDATDAGSTTGDGAGGAQADGKPLTKAEMIKEGDLLCKRSSLTIVSELNNNKQEYGPGVGNGSTPKQSEAGLLEVVLPALLREAQYISELNPPPGDEAEIEAMLDAFRAGIKKTEANPSLAFEGPNPLAKAANLSKQYGFKICGN